MTLLERRITITAVVVPFLAFIAAVVLLWGGLVSGRDLAIFAVMYAFVGFGVTIGFHRLLTHRSFTAPAGVRALLAILGSMSVQGAVIHWVADHRKHHAFTDEEGDPHSPHTQGGEGWRGVLSGMWHAHTGWLFEDGQRTSARRFAPDLKNDPAIRFVDRYFLLWVVLGLAIPFAAGFAIGGTLTAGLTALLWGGLVRVFVLHHATWSVNSVCHMYGTRPFVTDDESRNNWVVALVSLGEGWHHNHHAFPTSARHGLQGRQFDPSYMIIKGMEKVGLASGLKQPKPAEIERKLPGYAEAEPERETVAA
ncbi:MAG: fatty acid desaturase [Actinomycetota bacterium]|nr:fatty acid desaturase [Actinomycetota bacterium]